MIQKRFLVFIGQNRTSVAPFPFRLLWVSCQCAGFGLAKELQLVKTTAAACGTERKQRPHPLEGQHWDILGVNSSAMSQLTGRKKRMFALKTFGFWSASCSHCHLLAISQLKFAPDACLSDSLSTDTTQKVK